jgi:hypothetical protein
MKNLKCITQSLLLSWLFITTSQAQNFSILGTGTAVNSSTSYPAPFGNYYWGARQQFLYPAAELLAAGVVPGASINSVGFKITSDNGAQVHENFQITVYTTTANLNNQNWYSGVPASQTTPMNFPPGGNWPLGWQQFTLNTPFTWNGTDNLIVETCFQNSSYVSNASTEMTTMPAGMIYTLYYYADMMGVCSYPTVTGSLSDRPNVRLEWTATPCSGIPTPGQTLASSSSVCVGEVFQLTLSNVPPGTDVSYQWQLSPDGGLTWTDIGTSTPVLTYSLSSTADFRCIVTCVASGESASSDPVTVSVITDPCQCGAYPASAAVFTYGPDIVHVEINAFSNASICNDLSGGPGSIPGMYTNYTTLSSSPTALLGSLVSFSVITDMCLNGAYYHLKIFADWNQDGDFSDTDEELYATPSPQLVGTTVSGSFWVPTTALTGAARLRIIARGVWNQYDPNIIDPGSTYDEGETEDYCLSVIVPPPCAGQPIPGNTQSSASTVCAGQSVFLSLPDLPPASGYTYQWQQSLDGGNTWSNVSSGQPFAQVTVNGDVLFRCLVTCTVTGQNASSTPVSVIVNTDGCQCINYPVSSASDPWDADIVNVTMGSMTNSSACQDPAPGPGSQPGMYSNYTGNVAAPSVYQGFPVQFSVEADMCGSFYFPHLKIFADWNQDGDFYDWDEEVYASTSPLLNPGTFSGSFIVPAAAQLGTTRLRIVLQSFWSAFDPNTILPDQMYYYGETEDYCVDVQTPANCSGTPSPGATSASATSGCAGLNVTLSLPNLTPANGLSYQWQQSTNGGTTWSNFGPNQPYTTATVNTTTQYRCLVTCTASGQSAASSPVTVTIAGDNCQCLPYAVSGALYPYDGEILNVTLANMNNASSCGTAAPGPGSIANQYANFTTSVTGPSIMAGQPVNFSVQVGTCGGSYSNYLKIFADWNQDGDFFDAAETVYASGNSLLPPQTVNGAFTIPTFATPGPTRIRIVLMETWDSSLVQPEGWYTYGETEDYCLNVLPLTPCSGTPNPGNTLASVAEACPFQPFTLSLSNDFSNLSGISYQWQRSTNGGSTWSNFGPSAPVVTAIQSAPTLYRCQVTCAASGLTGTSSELSVPVGTPCVCQNYGPSGAAFPDNTYIYQVKVGGQTNTSTCTTLAPGPGSQVVQYSNYAGYLAPFEVESGKPFNFSVGVGTCQQGMVSIFKIFVDWNGDGDFNDQDEEAYTSANLTGGQLVNGVITAPLVSPLVTRLRVVCVETPIASVVTPTGTYNYGETEDYCLRIQPTVGFAQEEPHTTGPDRVLLLGQQLVLLLNNQEACGTVDVRVHDLAGRMISQKRFGYYGPGSYDAGPFTPSPGIYIVSWTYCGITQSQRLVLGVH